MAESAHPLVNQNHSFSILSFKSMLMSVSRGHVKIEETVWTTSTPTLVTVPRVILDPTAKVRIYAQIPLMIFLHLVVTDPAFYS